MKEAASGMEVDKLDEGCFTLRQERCSILAGKCKGECKLGHFLGPGQVVGSYFNKKWAVLG